MSQAKKKLLARIAADRFACELYLEETAALKGKRLCYVCDGIPIEPPPVE